MNDVFIISRFVCSYVVVSDDDDDDDDEVEERMFGVYYERHKNFDGMRM